MPSPNTWLGPEQSWFQMSVFAAYMYMYRKSIASQVNWSTFPWHAKSGKSYKLELCSVCSLSQTSSLCNIHVHTLASSVYYYPKISYSNSTSRPLHVLVLALLQLLSSSYNVCKSMLYLVYIVHVYCVILILVVCVAHIKLASDSAPYIQVHLILQHTCKIVQVLCCQHLV